MAWRKIADKPVVWLCSRCKRLVYQPDKPAECNCGKRLVTLERELARLFTPKR